MKSILFNLLLLFVAVPTMASPCDEDERFRHKKEKQLSETFDVTSDGSLKIDNSYGRVDITTWDQNTISIDVTIIVSGNRESRVDDKLEEIDVRFDQTGNMVSAITTFDNNDSGWNWRFWENNSSSMEINYVVKMPKANALDLDNDYGAVVIGDLDGNTEINVDYGSITTGVLDGNRNELRFDYSSGCSFEYVRNADINADYSGFILSNANQATIRADYTSSAVGKVGKVDYNGDYGSFKSGETDALTIRGDYVSFKIGIVNGPTSITTDYGSIRIAELGNAFGSLKIRSDYTGIKVGLAPDTAFNFDVDLEYASLKGDDLEFKIKDLDGSDKYYKGYRLRENSGNTINIESDYGSVSLREN